jgi:PAS domain S-box-containing protein
MNAATINNSGQKVDSEPEKVRPMWILVIDTEQATSEDMKKRLQQIGQLQVDAVQTENEATEKLKTKNYDAIVFNQDINQKKSTEFLRQLKQDTPAPLIITVQKKQDTIGVEALNFGVQKCVRIGDNLEESYTELVNTVLKAAKEKRAFDELKGREEKFRTMVEYAKDGIVLINEEVIITFWNHAAEQIFDYTAQEVLGKPLPMIMPPKRARGFEEARKQMFAGIKEKGFAGFQNRVAEMPGLRKNGETVPTEISMSILTIAGKWQGLAIIRDTTERKNALAALQNSEENFRSLAENSPDMIFINQKGKIVYANREGSVSLGYSKEELYAPTFNFLRLIAPESIDMVKAQFAKHLNGENLEPYECKLVTREGAIRDVIINSRIINYNGESALLGIATDITERKRAELEILYARENFRVYIENSPVAIFVADPEGKYEYTNAAASKLLGYSKEELLTMSISQLVFEEDLQIAFEKFKEVKETGHSLSELRLKAKSGSQVYIILNAVKLPDGKLLAFCENLTERKAAEKQILLQTERLKAIFAASPDAIISIDLAGNIVGCNEETLRLFGYASKKELIGKNCLDLVASVDRQKAFLDLRGVLQEDKTVRNKEFIGLKANGEEVSIEVSVSTLKDMNRQIAGMIATGKDITERKNAEKQIRLLSSVVEQTVEGIAVSDLQGKILFVNSAWLKMHNFENEEKELIGQDITRFYCGTQLEYADEMLKTESIFRGRITHVRKDRTTFQTLATLSPLKNANGQVIGTIHTAKNLTEIVRDIRATQQHNVCNIEAKT